MGTPLRRAAGMRDRLTAGDPGLVRTTTALRAVAGIALTLAVLSFTDLPDAFLVAGCFAPFTVALAAGDSPARDQVFMVVAAVPLVSAVLLAGGALAPFRVAAEAVFVLLIFWAVFVRRYGPGGQALGIFAFMAYFLTQFLDARLSQLPGLYAAVGVGFAADALVGFGLLRTTPAKTLRRLRRAFDLHLEHVVLGAIEVVRAGRDDTRLTWSLERRLARLHRSGLMIADLLDRGGAADPVRQGIVRAEVAAQRLAVLAVRSFPAFMGTTHDRATAALLNVHHAIGELIRAVDGLRSVADAPSYRGPRTNGAARRLRHVATRQAVQAAAAAAIAVVSGDVLSSERWYWAVLTAWVVFVNTESSGEVLVQGLQRLLGTVLGVACGLSIAALAGGCPPLALGVSLVCVFGVFRTPPNAYWAVTFFITCMIATVFVLLSTFSAELLALRVWETALGALCGVLAGTLVLPTTVRRASGERLLEVLRALRRTRVLEGGALLDTRELDRALEELRGALRPLTHPLNPRRAPRAHARHLLALLESCAYHVRSLAAVTAAAQMGEAEYEARAIERIRANLDRAIHLMEAGAWPTIPCHDGRRTLARLAADRWRGDHMSLELFHVNRLDEATAELAQTFDGGRVPCVMT
ncbi:FUSC family protein [Nonomuraea sp. LP-02]|uniref:FUSC family protein n=1 Tax=Nonomuraea sp. LP-02 TaxID=3097960 RepID=UPI002E31D273|nr:FUSC family protein [Nonomuraea sp. LP-02]MED7929545.1 FUSC family protein [Nonomuraea sp. LP-02]